jgi:hypothetical protein
MDNARRWVATNVAAHPRIVGTVLVVLLVALTVVRSHCGTRLDGWTRDEPWHVVAGASYERYGDYRLNPEHPPLVKLWAGAWAPERFRVRAPTQHRNKAQERQFVEEIMFADNDAPTMQPRMRIAMWTLHALLLIAIGVLLWSTFGLPWALGTLAFFAIEPTVGAHLPLVMTDLPVALFLIVSALCVGQLANGWRWRWVLGCGVALGCTLSIKHSALPGMAGLIVVLVIATLVRRGAGWRAVAQRVGKVAMVGLVAWIVVWSQYGFRFHSSPDGIDHFNRPMEEKLAGLSSTTWREAIGLADRWHLLPRAYLWGLADRVRAGVDGRDESYFFVWGVGYEGDRPPLHTWPSVIAGKIPLALLTLVGLAAVLIVRTRLPPGARWTMWAVAGLAGFFLLTLMTSRGTFGGIRHALPVVGALAVLAGAASSWAWERRSRPLLVAVVILYAAAFAMTIGEPRLWEYFNELAGGSEGGFRYFNSESVELGQRFPEIQAYYERVIAPSGLPFYRGYKTGMVDEQDKAAGVKLEPLVTSMDDTNVEGIHDGYFLNGMRVTVPMPWNDPKDALQGLVLVARFGQSGIWRGRRVSPRARAVAMVDIVEDYLDFEKHPDWALAARRLEEAIRYIVKPTPHVELGNVYLHLGQREAAVRAYRRPLDGSFEVPKDLRKALEDQIARIEAATDITTIAPLPEPAEE